MNLTDDYVNFATNLLSASSSHVNSSGYLTQVVNPLDFTSQGTQSPEGQSFIVMAYAAYNDWDNAGQSGNNGSSNPLSQSGAEKLVAPLSMGLGWAIAGVLALTGLGSMTML
jgi:hypothetical protein